MYCKYTFQSRINALKNGKQNQQTSNQTVQECPCGSSATRASRATRVKAKGFKFGSSDGARRAFQTGNMQIRIWACAIHKHNGFRKHAVYKHVKVDGKTGYVYIYIYIDNHQYLGGTLLFGWHDAPAACQPSRDIGMMTESPKINIYTWCCHITVSYTSIYSSMKASSRMKQICHSLP